jgi:hypothetical protein
MSCKDDTEISISLPDDDASKREYADSSAELSGTPAKRKRGRPPKIRAPEDVKERVAASVSARYHKELFSELEKIDRILNHPQKQRFKVCTVSGFLELVGSGSLTRLLEIVPQEALETWRRHCFDEAAKD